jgi:hypothetical protein
VTSLAARVRASCHRHNPRARPAAHRQASGQIRASVTATITVGDAPTGVAVSPTGANTADVYITNQNDGTVSVIR